MISPGRPEPKLDPDLVSFCESHYPRLVGLLVLHVGDHAIAEELAQDALLRACRNWDKVSQMEHRRAWLFRVAVNLANSWLRRRYAEARARIRHGVVDESLEPHSAEVIAVREAVLCLPRRQRTALVLRYFEQLPVADVADIMGCAPGTVKALTHRAITTLRERAGLRDYEEVTDAH